ncbi:hypothetical protein VB715_19330 [Crocosphaera sp. UHCC 0190]|uniref:hypothetical protein n=1 Tax=unclassified Crocosphaera TaxID=2623705 RepID=UPI002B21D250|nr:MULTISPECIES: hypothetical protein [unclassified Crocosphaera]MEA5511930.1 hypothetical protein [Crocosphaera sp. UHCC 0190]MEA5536661.1 hypothetical protein [Crocosphaera sp. XPORK-15E]
MIFHLSIAVDNPKHVASVLAEIFKGEFTEFPPHPGSYMSFAFDKYGTAIEVYPKGTELNPGTNQDELKFKHNDSSSQFTATHAAISVPLSQEEIEEIGQREGWRVVHCSREGLFEVMEFWLENTVMLELLTPEMAQQYQQTMNPEKLHQLFAQMKNIS